MGYQTGFYPLTDSTIQNKTFLRQVSDGDFPSIMCDDLFYSEDYGSASPTRVGTFLRPKNYIYFNAGDFLEDSLSVSFWFYPGDSNEGYVFSFTDGFYESTPFYVFYSKDTLEFGQAGWNETDEQAKIMEGYNQDQWHLLIITLQNDVDDDKATFKAYDPSNLDVPIVDLVYPARASFKNMWVNLGNYNGFTSSFSGFVYNLIVWSKIMDSEEMSSLFVTACDGHCSICPSEGICLDFGSLYPVGAHEFDPIKLCDPTCDAYCQGPSNKDSTEIKADSSCTPCFDVELEDDKGNCACPAGKGHVFTRGELSGCTACADGCKECNTEGETPICDKCADPAANPDTINPGQGDSCLCPKNYTITGESLGFCVMVCAKECDSCADGVATYCNSCSYELATANNGVCECKQGYFSTNSTDGPLSCSPCDPECSDCEGAPDYCTECPGEGWAAFDGNCVCDYGFYPSFDIVDGNSVPTCAPCSESCDKCDKNCFMCTDINNSDGNDNCFTSSLGYQMKFRRGIITVTFSQDLDKPLDKYDFNVQDNEGTWHDASYWNISMVSPSEYKIFTDLTKDDLPVQVFFTFAKVELIPE